jgi:hypothetical protein
MAELIATIFLKADDRVAGGTRSGASDHRLSRPSLTGVPIMKVATTCPR